MKRAQIDILQGDPPTSCPRCFALIDIDPEHSLGHHDWHKWLDRLVLELQLNEPSGLKTARIPLQPPSRKASSL